jgi:hypothetical protein
MPMWRGCPDHDKLPRLANTGLRNGRGCRNTVGLPDVVEPNRRTTIGRCRRNSMSRVEMTPNEIARVQDYLRRTFGNDRITIVPPPKRGAPIEVMIGDEFIGVVHRDDEEGEVSYDLHMTILAEDLPSASAVPEGKAKPTRKPG